MQYVVPLSPHYAKQVLVELAELEDHLGRLPIALHGLAITLAVTTGQVVTSERSDEPA